MMSPQHVAQLLQSKAATIVTLQHQLDWFKRQLFGKKSERFAPEPDPQQMHLGQMLDDVLALPEQVEAGSTVPAHTRRKPSRDFADESRDAPFFDAAVVPVQTIEVPSPEAQGLAPEQYEVIGEKVCCVPCDHVPIRSWPLFRAREVVPALIRSLKQELRS